MGCHSFRDWQVKRALSIGIAMCKQEVHWDLSSSTYLAVSSLSITSDALPSTSHMARGTCRGTDYQVGRSSSHRSSNTYISEEIENIFSP